MAIVRTSTKGQVVIPGEIRKKLGLKAGQRLSVNLTKEGKIELTPLPLEPAAAFCGIYKQGKSLTGVLLREHRQELKSEKHLRP
ncbi:MAG: AbrB/MazE/SpoVT family DNA-binding domain-containing protein [Chloroflexi bacterium]|nr:AbrB/MazE/SpoVT family DNA-binding domain-containing protein [Chloroflexota bacterium]